MRLADLPARLHEFDIVVSCTASQLPIIGLGAVERALKARKHRPMFMVDLAVPRDIEPEVKALEDVYLYTVDDLAQVVQTGPGQPPGRRGPGRSHHRRRRAELHALDGPARHGAADPAAQRAGRRVARRRTGACPQAAGQGRIVDAVLEACRAASRRRCCTAPWPSCMRATPHRASSGADHLALLPAQRALATLVRCGPPFTGAPVRPSFFMRPAAASRRPSSFNPSSPLPP
jgi:hypothetical protein